MGNAEGMMVRTSAPPTGWPSPPTTVPRSVPWATPTLRAGSSRVSPAVSVTSGPPEAPSGRRARLAPGRGAPELSVPEHLGLLVPLLQLGGPCLQFVYPCCQPGHLASDPQYHLGRWADWWVRWSVPPPLGRWVGGCWMGRSARPPTVHQDDTGDHHQDHDCYDRLVRSQSLLTRRPAPRHERAPPRTGFGNAPGAVLLRVSALAGLRALRIAPGRRGGPVEALAMPVAAALPHVPGSVQYSAPARPARAAAHRCRPCVPMPVVAVPAQRCVPARSPQG